MQPSNLQDRLSSQTLGEFSKLPSQGAGFRSSLGQRDCICSRAGLSSSVIKLFAGAGPDASQKGTLAKAAFLEGGELDEESDCEAEESAVRVLALIVRSCVHCGMPAGFMDCVTEGTWAGKAWRA